MLKPKLKVQYENLRDGSFDLDYCAGIASGEVLVVRAGIRGSNDLLWVGRSANIAAKLSDIRNEAHKSFITEDVFKMLREDVKLGPNGESMWTKFNPYGDAGVIYGSSWHWQP